MSFKFAALPADNEEISFSKKLILVVSAFCSICGIFWSAMYYVVFGTCLITILPLSFTAIVSSAIVIAHLKKNHLILVYTQLIAILWITAIIQWSIGNINDSGVVIAWGFLGTIGALLFLKRRESIFWILQFLFVLLVTVVVEPKLTSAPIFISSGWRKTFYIMNLGFPAIAVFAASSYFLKRMILSNKQNEKLLQITQDKNEEIQDSIHYAKRIQAAILPPTKLVKEYLKESFVLYLPKDVVAGDFYWMEHAADSVLFAAADCTGHGVPGAMVSVVCNNALNRSVREYGLTEPAKILDKAREIVIQEFDKSEEEVKDGMDISLCALNTKTNELKWSGANNPLWILRKGAEEIEEVKADKQPIGKFEMAKPFTNHTIQLNEGDTFFVFSDGFPDQFGGEKGKKYKSGKLKKTFISLANKSIEEYGSILQKEFESWRGDIEQVDDVCVIGVRV